MNFTQESIAVTSISAGSPPSFEIAWRRDCTDDRLKLEDVRLVTLSARSLISHLREKFGLRSTPALMSPAVGQLCL